MEENRSWTAQAAAQTLAVMTPAQRTAAIDAAHDEADKENAARNGGNGNGTA